MLIASIFIVAGFFNSQIPAYFFKDSGINTYYWYSNRLPKMDEYKVAGEWTSKYIPQDSTIGVEFDTRTIPFFYSKHKYSNVRMSPTKYSDDYIMANPSIPYDCKGCEKMYFDQDLSVIYYNMEN